VTRYLTPEQVMFLHSRLIQETGGAHGIRDLSMLLSALGRVQATFDGKELYADIFAKGAALFDSLIRNHPFVDGNKRTAIASAGMFLLINGFSLQVSNDEMVQFTLSCAQSEKKLDEIVSWLKLHSTKMP
jgi:death-on-curing family protein